MEQELIQILNADYRLTLPENLSRDQLESRMALFINELILSDFATLVRLLYRIDVPETRLKQLLREHPESDAALVIARLIVERQEQKIKTRQAYSRRKEDIPEEDRW